MIALRGRGVSPPPHRPTPSPPSPGCFAPCPPAPGSLGESPGTRSGGLKGPRWGCPLVSGEVRASAPSDPGCGRPAGRVQFAQGRLWASCWARARTGLGLPCCWPCPLAAPQAAAGWAGGVRPQHCTVGLGRQPQNPLLGGGSWEVCTGLKAPGRGRAESNRAEPQALPWASAGGRPILTPGVCRALWAGWGRGWLLVALPLGWTLCAGGLPGAGGLTIMECRLCCCLTPVHGAWGAQKPTGEVHHCLPRASLCGTTQGWSWDLPALAGCPLLSLPQAGGCSLVCERETCRGHQGRLPWNPSCRQGCAVILAAGPRGP